VCVIGTPRSRISFVSTMLLNPSAPFGCPCAEAKSLQSQQRRLICTFPRLRQTGGQHRLRDGAAKGQCPVRVCAVTRRRFPVGASPTRQTLQPEAIGAVMEVTKWLKPSISVSRIGDSASVQAVTRVNAEQASKMTMRRPTRRPFRGRLIRLGE
jgi:hypothetical protein